MSNEKFADLIKQILMHCLDYSIAFKNNLFSFARLHSAVLIKIAIPFLIIIGGFYSCSSLKRSIKSSVYEIFELSNLIRNHYSSKPNYWGLSSQYIIDENIFPKSYIRKDKITLKSGQEILIGSGPTGESVMPGNMNFDIVLPKLTKAQCIAYAEYPYNQNQLVEIESISIQSLQKTVSFTWGGTYPLPVKKQASKNLCDDLNNTVILTFK